MAPPKLTPISSQALGGGWEVDDDEPAHRSRGTQPVQPTGLRERARTARLHADHTTQEERRKADVREAKKQRSCAPRAGSSSDSKDASGACTSTSSHERERSLQEMAALLLPLHDGPESPSKAGGSGSPSRALSEDAAKLELVLDLDHTLLHAAEAPPERGQPPRGVHAFNLGRPSGGESRYFVRTRDALHSFLEQLQLFAKLHVYTMASKSYTWHVLNAIDPDLSIFKNKILCRSDGQSEIFDKSITHIQISPTDGREGSAEDAMIIVDDREDVWDPYSREAVLKVPPFRCFGQHGVSLPEPPTADVALMDVLRVLRKVHRDWSSGLEPTARAALHSYRRGVLSGVQLVLSGGLLQDAEQPQRCLYWRLAELYGAKCHLTWTSSTTVTHVVSGRPDTGSVEKALKSPNVHAVKPEWLLDSARRWCKQCEALYALRPEQHLLRPDETPFYAAENSSELPAEKLPDIIPSDVSDNDRLKAAIKFILPAAKREQSFKLFERFDGYTSKNDGVGKQEVLTEITALVGVEQLVNVLNALNIK
uniref:protein-serine/threonine phosphatase n=1 Tax=Calcidiscus leptoporus TaxID=127549 RepID=A0A7S0J2L6_9EUKA|mmetsp:Transcript_34594/g.81047  ORF Transcript_34594/g.81047 Transcript_34594/m.81047 type:complete len:538 (+) Transcript_34594:16-1629(+)